jgi:uncharacterized protein (DUF934 family)
MTMILRLNPSPHVEGAPNAPVAAPEPVAPVTVEGRGDGRLATYKKKPTTEKPPGPDWAALGFSTMPEWVERTTHDRETGHAIALEPTDDPQHLSDKLDGVTVIAVHFPKFTDGRGYSIASILRKRFGYTGELRAVGDVQRDQLFLMARCGFDAFALRDDQDPDACLGALTDFSVAYQDAADGRAPAFRDRS